MRDQNMFLTQLKSVSRTRILLQLSPLINPLLKLQLAEMMMMMIILRDKSHFQQNQVYFFKELQGLFDSYYCREHVLKRQDDMVLLLMA